MTLQEKAKALNKLDREIIRLMKRSMALSKKPPPKTLKGAFTLSGKILKIFIAVRQLEMQKRMVISQPTPKFPPGSYQAMAVGETHHEIIKLPK